MSAFISISELERFTGTSFSGVYDEVYLTEVIEVISEHIQDAYADYQFVQETFTRRMAATLRRNGVLLVTLPKLPVVSVEALKVFPPGMNALDVTMAHSMLDQAGGMLRVWWHELGTPRYGFIPADLIAEVTFTAGVAETAEELPVGVKVAVALLVWEWVAADQRELQGKPGLLQSFTLGPYTERYAIPDGFGRSRERLGMGTSKSLRAAQLLDRFVRKGMLAV